MLFLQRKHLPNEHKVRSIIILFPFWLSRVREIATTTKLLSFRDSFFVLFFWCCPVTLLSTILEECRLELEFKIPEFFPKLKLDLRLNFFDRHQSKNDSQKKIEKQTSKFNKLYFRFCRRPKIRPRWQKQFQHLPFSKRQTFRYYEFRQFWLKFIAKMTGGQRINHHLTKTRFLNLHPPSWPRPPG